MKALTLTQPWASLVAREAKTVETRSWRTDYRGPLAIHAAKGFPIDAAALCFQQPFAKALGRDPEHRWNPRGELPRGLVLAVARLVDVVPTDTLGITDVAGDVGWLWHGLGASITDDERTFGDYTPGRWAWLLYDIDPLPEPVPARGALGLWDWEPTP